MEVLAPNDNISRYNDSSCTDNHSGEQISINVISNNDDHTKCDFHTLILDCSSWNQVDTVGVKALMSVRFGFVLYVLLYMHFSSSHTNYI